MKENRYKSDTTGETIPVCIIEFNDGSSDLWYHKNEYDELGYKGVLKDMVLSPRNIKKVHKIVVHPQRFPINEWEP